MILSLYKSNIKSIKSSFIYLIILAQILFINNVFASNSKSTKINTSDSVLAAIEKIIESNFFLPSPTNKDKQHNKNRLLTSDLEFEYRFSQLNIDSDIELEYNIHVKKYIETFLLERGKNISAILGLSKFYFPVFEQKLNKYNLPNELKYLAIVESSLNPMACSGSGAVGLWQFLYGTGEMLGLERNTFIDDRYDAHKSTEAACKYLIELFHNFNDWHLALAAYNSGTSVVWYAVEKSGGLKNYWSIRKYLPEQAQNFIPAFIAANYVLKYAHEHNISPFNDHINFINLDTLQINTSLHLSSISDVLNIPNSVLKFLNPSYTKNFIPASNNPMNLVLPSDKKKIFFYKSDLIVAKEKLLQESIRLLEQSMANKGMQKIWHIVNKKEQIDDIAKKYGCQVMEIIDWNHLIFKRVYVGQELKIWILKKHNKKTS